MHWVLLLGQLSVAEAPSLARPQIWLFAMQMQARRARSGPEGPAAGPKGPHVSEASDEPRSGEEPVPEATH